MPLAPEVLLLLAAADVPALGGIVDACSTPASPLEQAVAARALAKIKERNSSNVMPEGVMAQRMAEASFGESVATPSAANPENPTIQIPNTRMQKSEFNATSTSTQWWDDESYQKVNARKNAGKREETK